MKELTAKQLQKLISNPFYCLSKVAPIFCEPHEAIVSEDTFIRAGIVAIEQEGAEQYLKNLLENLKGNYE